MMASMAPRELAVMARLKSRSIWAGAAILPHALTVEMPKGILAGADAVFKMAPGLPGVRSADICGPAVEWSWRVRTKTLAHRGERKRFVLGLMENTG